MRGLRLGVVFVSLMTCGMGAAARVQETKGIPPHGVAVVLFDGKDLGSFDVFLKSKGLNNDPEHVFTVENGALHVSGKEMGYVITKQAYHDYYLRAEFKWGEGTFGEREGKARDSGILYNVQGEQKVWPRSVEFQVEEGGTGDFWLTDGAAVTGRDGKRVVGPAGKALNVPRFDRAPLVNTVGYRSPTGEVEKPHGEWNVLELVVQGNTVKHYVNGKLVNIGRDPFPAEGKILFQSEGSEVYFRDMKLYPLQ